MSDTADISKTLMSLISNWYQQYNNWYQSQGGQQGGSPQGGGGLNMAAPVIKYPGDGQSHGYGQGGFMQGSITYGDMSDGGGGAPRPMYGPPRPNFTPYNNGDMSTQAGGPVGPYFSNDANAAVARMYSAGGGGGGGSDPAGSYQYGGGGGNSYSPPAPSVPMMNSLPAVPGYPGGVPQSFGYKDPSPPAAMTQQYDPYVYSAMNDPFNYEYDGGMIANPNGYMPMLADDGSGASVYYGEPGFSF